MFRKTIPFLAVALLVCAALLFQAVPVSAAETVSTDEPEATLQAPPPPPHFPYVAPCPPQPPLPPAPMPAPRVSYPNCPSCCDCRTYPTGYNCCDYCDCRGCSDCCDCCDCCVQKVVVVETIQKTVVCTPVISSFSSCQSCVQSCQDVVLTWSTSNASTVTISPNIGSVATSGSRTVRLCSTTTYTLIASNSSGSVSASTTITVTPQATISSASIGSGVVIGSSTGAGAGSILTMGIGGSDSPLSSIPVYLVLIALIAIAAMAITVFVVKKRPVAVSGFHAATATVAGYAPWSTGTQTATEMPGTTPMDMEGPAGFITDEGRHIPLSGKSKVMGRSDFRPFITPDKASQISREHVKIYCEKGNYYIEDSSSINGTRLNGSRITGKGRFMLADGDVIAIADVLSLTFKI
jgi:hypothetical protein